MERDKKLMLRKMVKPYERSALQISLLQVLNTLVPYLALVAISMATFQISPWISVAVSIIAAFFLVRTFIIFHDCCHGSFFKNKKWNDTMGNFTGFLTMFPYQQWRREHNIHHATSGNLDKKGIGDIWMMTIEEYEAAGKWTKLGYRLYRNPFVMFVIGPLYLLFITNRLNSKGAKPKERMNTYLHNIAILVVYGAIIWYFGFAFFAAVFFPIMFVGAMLGIWMFYIQHTFEESYFEENSEWDYVKAAVEGSSYYKLPKLLQWLTGNIGFHHVHHLSPRIPNYYLETAHKEVKPLQYATTITLKDSLETIKYKLYDEKKKVFITFKDYYRNYAKKRTI
ncbi:fatty acid desaturase [Macrococcoides canis]|uniref:fatty acid desaturase n=1 Tax=Macrococcoides canis TaxID=1855823 RepID=UPI0013E906F8|nr:fatty acid desaturase [Macrococcus canis]QIH74910.1 fatty acid desaturase [Macrococcus canis]QTQ08295.1 fatty acid desaturase [Macrococcus canis]